MNAQELKKRGEDAIEQQKNPFQTSGVVFTTRPAAPMLHGTVSAPIVFVSLTPEEAVELAAKLERYEKALLDIHGKCHNIIQYEPHATMTDVRDIEDMCTDALPRK